MTYTIWSNGGKFEWLIRNGKTVIDRSGLFSDSHQQTELF